MNTNANPSPDRPSGNKTPYIIGALILLAGLFAFWWFGRNSEESDNSHSTVADTTIVTDECDEQYPTGSVVGLAITGEELIALLQDNARLRAELDACLGIGPKKAATTTRTTTRSTKKSAPTSSSKTETRESVPAHSATSSNVTGANLAISRYKGVMSGDVCVTFDDNSMLIYCINKKILDGIPGLSSPNPNVNNEFRNVYEYNGYYIATSNIIVDVNMLLNQMTFSFAWYAGGHDNGYGIWLPHELYKEKINPYYPHAYNDPSLAKALLPYKVRPNKHEGYEYFDFPINYEPK
ncbi:MAG: hypothetical protein Q8Q67_03135 [bacterium]|nr:hypothetical protein [bacterium]